MPMSSPQMTRMLGLRAGRHRTVPRARPSALAPGPLRSTSPQRRWTTYPTGDFGDRSTCLLGDWLSFLFSNSLLIRYSLCCCTSFLFVLTGKRRPHHAAEPDMAGRGIDRLGVARGGAIAAAIIRRAEMRAAFQDFARDADVWLTWIKARFLAPAARIARDAARLCAHRPACFVDHQSEVHSQTLPIMSCRP